MAHQRNLNACPKWIHRFLWRAIMIRVIWIIPNERTLRNVSRTGNLSLPEVINTQLLPSLTLHCKANWLWELKKMVNSRIMSSHRSPCWAPGSPNTKFSKFICKRMYGTHLGELLVRSWHFSDTRNCNELLHWWTVKESKNRILIHWKTSQNSYGSFQEPICFYISWIPKRIIRFS